MFSTLLQIITTPLKSLLSNKMRSFLTMLGVIIGVGAVIIIMSVGAGAQSLIISQIKTLGTNLVGVLPGKSEDKGPPASIMGIVITTLTYEDALALAEKQNVPNIVAVSAHAQGVASVNWESNEYDTNISGITASYMDVEGGEVKEGRFITKEEESNLSKVAVLGSTVAKELFGATDPIGRQIKIKKHSFEVIGTMKERGTVGFQNADDQIFIPVRTMQKLISGVNYLGFIRAKVDYEENIPLVMSDMATTLRERHGITDKTGASDDFTIRSAAAQLEIITTVTNALKYFLAAMAAISLVVGGIGIMNIMLISVRERTREIGLRKAIGANNSDILSQFLIEATTITLLGGIIGIIGGTILSFLVSVIIKALGYSWDFVISPSSVILASLVSIAVGLAFGIYPARKASQLQPVEALRYE